MILNEDAALQQGKPRRWHTLCFGTLNRRASNEHFSAETDRVGVETRVRLPVRPPIGQPPPGRFHTPFSGKPSERRSLWQNLPPVPSPPGRHWASPDSRPTPWR